MSEIVWMGGTGLVLGLGPDPRMDADAPLPEALEDQLASVLSNLDALLASQQLDRRAIAAVRVNLTQFQRFETRALRAYQRNAGATGPAQLSWVGVTDLPRDALVAMDVWLTRSGVGASG